MDGDLRAVAVGIGVFVVLTVAHLALETWTPMLSAPFGWLAIGMVNATPFVSGFVCGYLLQSRRFLPLLVLGIGASLCLGALNFGWGLIGFPVDLGGIRNVPWVIGLSLLSVIPLVALGGAIGVKLNHGAHA